MFEHIAGIEGYANANFNNPQDNEEKTWGKMKIPLCSLEDSSGSLDRGLKDRKIVFSSSCSHLRKKLSEDSYGKWIQKSNEFMASHWHQEVDFDQIVKRRVEHGKQIKLAGRNQTENDEPLYTGEQEAEVNMKTEDGEWTTTKNKEVTRKYEEKDDDFYDTGARSKKPTIPAYKDDYYYGSRSSASYYNSPRRLPPPPSESSNQYDHFYHQIGSDKFVRLPEQQRVLLIRELCSKKNGQDWEHFATALGLNLPDRNLVRVKQGCVDRLETKHGFENTTSILNEALDIFENKCMQQNITLNMLDHVSEILRDERVFNKPYNNLVRELQMGCRDRSPASQRSARSNSRIAGSGSGSISDNIVKKLDFDNLADKFQDVSVSSPWNMRDNPAAAKARSPSPDRSPFAAAGIEKMPKQNEKMTQKMLQEQEQLRKEIEGNLAALNAIENSDEFEIENFTQENMFAITDPTLLQGDYVQRMNIMDSINQRLLEKLEKKKQRLALLQSREKDQKSSEPPGRSERNKRVNQDGDYEYY